MKKLIILAAGVLLIPRFSFCNTAKVASVTGNADIRAVKTAAWRPVKTGDILNKEETIKTKPRSRAKINLTDGSSILIYPNSQVSFTDLKKETPSIKVLIGKIKAWVAKNAARNKFEVHTPVAVCSVRGTEFDVTVDEDGKTDIEVFEGLLGVRREDGTGEEIPVGAGEKLGVDATAALDKSMKSEFGSEIQNVKNEVGLDMSKEEVQAAAAQEEKLAEYQEGKAMIDVFGKRVRLEEYIMRPAADTFKLVVLNERDNRFDYFYYKGQFNKTLPAELSVALRELGGKIDSQPEYYLTAYETGRSNTQDKILENASGGHLVDVNNNAASDDDITNYYNPATDTFETVAAGRAFYKPLYNNYSYKIDNVEKISWQPKTGVTNTLSSNDLAFTYAGQVAISQPEWASGEDLFHQRVSIFYGDGTWEKWDNYIINDKGEIAKKTEFDNITTGAAYKAELLKWNYETVITASEFGGRKIDLCVEPKILIKSGIIK
jgi:hypothetical protein